MRSSRLLRANAAFLMFMGGAAAIADAVGHFLGKGPFGAVMFRATLSISSFEAHLLAVIIGALLWTSARRPDRRLFHVLAAAVHVVLGASNLLFFESAFGALDMRVFGAVVTTAHVAFVLAQGMAAARLPSTATGAAAPQAS